MGAVVLWVVGVLDAVVLVANATQFGFHITTTTYQRVIVGVGYALMAMQVGTVWFALRWRNSSTPAGFGAKVVLSGAALMDAVSVCGAVIGFTIPDFRPGAVLALGWALGNVFALVMAWRRRPWASAAGAPAV